MATDQAKIKKAEENRKRKPSPINGQVLPAGFEAHPERRNPGGWKKEDTARFKLERMMELTEDELKAVATDPNAPLFERKLATLIRNGQWAEISGMMNQVYGMPKQEIKGEVQTPTPLVDLTKRKKK